MFSENYKLFFRTINYFDDDESPFCKTAPVSFTKQWFSSTFSLKILAEYKYNRKLSEAKKQKQHFVDSR